MVDSAAALEACLKGDPEATRALVDDLTPIIQSRAARALLRRRNGKGGKSIAQDVEELTQEVFLVLFADGARILRTWDREKGASLRTFVGLVAEREIADILASGRRRPWNDRTSEEPTEAQIGAAPDAEGAVAAKEMYAQLSARLREELSPQGYALFEMLLVDEVAVEDAMSRTGMSRDAIYQWRSRLPKIIRRIVEALSSG